MRTLLWGGGAVLIWWLVATLNCGGLACFPYITFFYFPWYVVAIAYAAVTELMAERLSARWSPALFSIFAIVGFVVLVVYFRFGPAPYLFADPERSMTIVRLVLWPAGCVCGVFLAKSLGHWAAAPDALWKSSMGNASEGPG